MKVIIKFDTVKYKDVLKKEGVNKEDAEKYIERLLEIIDKLSNQSLIQFSFEE
jgi:hypothetical protein